ncbi:MAG: hypothetical protein R3212_00945 [Xanthomonadales bacterium]|nr:hypothetical protein [Xanthomonadales bacterium]
MVELLASVVLIASIAVLALPTYQDFAPHSDGVMRIVSQAPHAERESADSPFVANPIENQPVSVMDDRKKEEGSQFETSEGVDDD